MYIIVVDPFKFLFKELLCNENIYRRIFDAFSSNYRLKGIKKRPKFTERQFTPPYVNYPYERFWEVYCTKHKFFK